MPTVSADTVPYAFEVLPLPIVRDRMVVAQFDHNVGNDLYRSRAS